MRIVAMADTHLFHDALAAHGRVPDGDVLVHAGDMLQYGSLDELERAIAFLASFPHRTKVVVAGNHEVCLEKRPAEARARLADAGFVYLEDEATTIDGVRFYGSPWQPKFRIWAFGAARGPELASKWARIPRDLDVLVTHGPPYGFGDTIRWRDEDRHVGCKDLLARVQIVRPRLHLFGHIHQARGMWTVGPTRFANVTTNEGEAPATVIDLASGPRGDQNETFGAAVDSGDAAK
ncbi:MAG: metallophosphoesterase [Deltaproteobacteria bacterium]|nr:metallophosphoesterase [Deltaproteobacteria bacterium]